MFSLQRLFFLFGLVWLSTQLHAQDPVLNENFWVTNGTVHAIEHDEANDLVYIGGSFTYVGPNEPHGAVIDETTGAVDLSFANPNGRVYASIPDGNDGWFIGGEFTEVGGVPRNYLAQIDGTGEVTNWNPNVDGSVFALALSGTTLYVGGFFTSMGGQSRNNIAALDATTGTATGWNPDASDIVLDIALSGSTVYACGIFSSIGGQTRNRIAALDISTGAATSWNPNASGGVNAIAVSGSTVYAGGGFSSIGGETRNHIAALDATTGASTSWNPNASETVQTLAVSGSTVYVGGNFTSIGGESRNHIAALDVTTGTATSWNPNANSFVNTLAVSGSTVYAGGSFTSIGGQARNNIAALDATTAMAASWNPNANASVWALTISGSKVYVGGDFTSIDGQSRNYIAALDATTGIATSWNPDASSPVNALAVSGSTVYAGGYFTSIGGESRNRIAALDATTGAATVWNPDASSPVNALAVSGSTVYAGGNFASIGGESRNRIAALDATTGAATSWNPNASLTVNALAVSGSIVYAGGAFTSIGGESRDCIAALDATTGAATGWNPNVSGVGVPQVLALAVSGSIVYVGGIFSSIGGVTRNRIAALDATTGTATGWNPNASSSVRTLAVSGSSVYAGGVFTSIGGQTRNCVAALNATTGTATGWNPGANSPVEAFAVSGSTVYAGGSFTSIGGQQRSHLAAFDLCASPEVPNLSSTETTLCPGSETTLSIASGELNEATDWQWYTESCDGTLVGTGTSIEVYPEETTTYYVRGEGGCVAPGDCAEITITFTPAVTGTDVQSACGTYTWIDGNTYTESNNSAQFNIVGGAVNGCDSLVTLNLTITGAFDQCGICYEDGDSDPDWNQTCADCEGTPNGTALPGNPCDDGSACTFNDTYDNDCNCVGTPVSCDDGDPCTIDSCDPLLGCVNTPLPDTDGDGICDEQDNCPFTVGVIGDNCTTGGGDPGVINGDCECIALVINGCTDPAACNYNDSATDDDGSCFYVCNDVAEDALELPITALGTCDGLPQDMFNALTNDDLWYSFTASTAGVRVEVATSDFDAVLELLDADMNVLAGADDVFTLGGEILNYGALTPGEEYLIRVVDSDGGSGSRDFSICVQFINGTQCDSAPGSYSLCQLFKAKWAGAGSVNYIFTFAPIGGGTPIVYETNAAFTWAPLSNVPGLLWGEDYDLTINVEYELTNGSGATEVVEIENNAGCVISIADTPTAALRPADNLANAGPHFLGAYIYANPWACTAIGWTWEFTNTDNSQLPIEYYKDGAPRVVRLIDVPGLQLGATYDVRVKPEFPTAIPTAYGAVDQIAIVGAVGMVTEIESPVVMAEDRVEETFEGAAIALYPNPNRGDFVNLNIANIEAGVDRVLVDIYDLAGKRVASEQIAVNASSSLNMVMSLNGIADGMYIVNIIMNGEVHTERMMIQK